MVSAVLLASDIVNAAAITPDEERRRCEKMIGALHSARILDIVLVSRQPGDRSDGREPLRSVTCSDAGEVAALVCGIDALGQTDLHGAIACRIDLPDLTQALLVDLLQGFWRSRKNIIRPASLTAEHSPIIFSRSMFDTLRSAPSGAGINDILRVHSGDICDVPVVTAPVEEHEHSPGEAGEEIQ